MKNQLEQVKKQELEFTFDSFNHLDAWNLGKLMVEEMYRRNLNMAICIRNVEDDSILFQHLSEQTSSLHEMYMLKKYRLVKETKSPSYLKFIEMSISKEAIDSKYLDKSTYMVKGGGFPIKNHKGTLFAVITVSNLDHPDDHQFIIDCLSKYKK